MHMGAQLAINMWIMAMRIEWLSNDEISRTIDLPSWKNELRYFLLSNEI